MKIVRPRGLEDDPPEMKPNALLYKLLLIKDFRV